MPNSDFGNMAAYAESLHKKGLKLGLYGAASGVCDSLDAIIGTMQPHSIGYAN